MILSTDKGYSLEQIVGAIMSERLEGNGDIKNGAGSIEAPVNPPLNMIIVGLASGKRGEAATCSIPGREGGGSWASAEEQLTCWRG